MQRSFGSSDKDIDDVKLMLSDTNPYLLGLTVVVSLLHTIFDVLAFKNGKNTQILLNFFHFLIFLPYRYFLLEK